MNAIVRLLSQASPEPLSDGDAALVGGLAVGVLLFWFLIVAVAAILPGWIATTRGRSFWAYFGLGLLISPLLAILIVMLLPAVDRRSSYGSGARRSASGRGRGRGRASGGGRRRGPPSGARRRGPPPSRRRRPEDDRRGPPAGLRSRRPPPSDELVEDEFPEPVENGLVRRRATAPGSTAATARQRERRKSRATRRASTPAPAEPLRFFFPALS